MWQGPLCARERLAGGLCLDLWKGLRKMSLERRGKTLGINNWKFNQGGFKDGGSTRVRTCRAVLFSNSRAVKPNPSGFEISLLRESDWHHWGDFCPRLLLLWKCVVNALYYRFNSNDLFFSGLSISSGNSDCLLCENCQWRMKTGTFSAHSPAINHEIIPAGSGCTFNWLHQLVPRRTVQSSACREVSVAVGGGGGARSGSVCKSRVWSGWRGCTGRAEH